MTDPITLVTSNKTEAEIAAELKAEFNEAIKSALAVMDKASKAGLQIGWEQLTATPPYFTHQVVGLKVFKTVQY